MLGALEEGLLGLWLLGCRMERKISGKECFEEGAKAIEVAGWKLWMSLCFAGLKDGLFERSTAAC